MFEDVLTYPKVGAWEATFANHVSFPIGNHAGGFSSSPNLTYGTMTTLTSPVTATYSRSLPGATASCRGDYGRLSYSTTPGLIQSTIPPDPGTSTLDAYTTSSPAFVSPSDAVSVSMYNGSVYGLGDSSRAIQGITDARAAINPDSRFSEQEYQSLFATSLKGRSTPSTRGTMTPFATASLYSSLPGTNVDRSLPPLTHPERRDSLMTGTADQMMRARYPSTTALVQAPTSASRYPRPGLPIAELPTTINTDIRYTRAAMEWNPYPMSNPADAPYTTTAGDMGPPLSRYITTLPDTGNFGYIPIHESADTPPSTSSLSCNASLPLPTSAMTMPHGMPLPAPAADRGFAARSDNTNAYTLSSAAAHKPCASINEAANATASEDKLVNGQPYAPLAHPQPKHTKKWKSFGGQAQAQAVKVKPEPGAAGEGAEDSA